MNLRTSFAEGTLLPALTWHCEPAHWSVRADDRCLRIEPDAGTDFWRTTHYGFDADNGAFLFAEDVVLHTRQQRIFGIAFGMDALAFMLPSSLHPEALAAGGTLYPDIGDDWIEWRRTLLLDTKRWCKAAHDYAVGGGTNKRHG